MRKAVTLDLTDAAAEFAALMERLRSKTDGAGQHTWTVIRSLLHEGDDNSVFRAYSIIKRRIRDLQFFISNLDDDYIDDALSNAAIASIDRLGEIFAPHNMTDQWQTAVSNYIKTSDINTVKFMSRTVRAYRPIVKIKSENLAHALDQLEKAGVEISEHPDLPDWAKTCFEQALFDLDFALRNIELFGQDEAINQLMRLHASAQAVSNEIESTKGKRVTLGALAIAFIMTVDLFTSIPNVAQAIPVWTGWVGQLKQIEVPLLMPPPKQIEGPRAAETEKA